MTIKDRTILSVETFARKARPFFQYCAKNNKQPDEKLMTEFYDGESIAFKLFLILYSFYFYTDQPASDLDKKYRMNCEYAGFIINNLLPNKIEEIKQWFINEELSREWVIFLRS